MSNTMKNSKVDFLVEILSRSASCLNDVEVVDSNLLLLRDKLVKDLRQIRTLALEELKREVVTEATGDFTSAKVVSVPSRRGRPKGSKNKKRSSTTTRKVRPPMIHPRSQKPPFGYTLNAHGNLIPDPTQIELIPAMKYLRSKGYAYRYIAENVLSILSRKGIDVALAHSTVRKILLNDHPLVRPAA